MKKPQKINVLEFRVFDNMLEGIQIISPEYKYVYVNDPVVSQSKTTREALIGHRMIDVYPGIEHTNMFRLLKHSMENRVNKSLSNEFEFPDGSIGYFDLIYTPVDAGVMIMSIDNTERKLLEIELKRINEHLEEIVNERTEELCRSLESERQLNQLSRNVISVMSHDFKTPLVAIQVNVNVLENHNDEPHAEQRLKIYEHIKDAVKGMHDTLEDYLTAGRIEAGQLNTNATDINIREFMRLKMNKLNVLLKPGQTIKYAHEGSEEFKFDRRVLKSIVANLISNAIKYSDEEIDILTTLKNDQLLIEVEDRGIGIPEKEMKKIGGKYFRASNAKNHGGTGLGLNIVKKYVDLFNGELEILTEENVGSKFRVKLPVD